MTVYKVSKGFLPSSTDLNQYYDVLTGSADIGAVTLFQSLPAPNAPTAAVVANTSGNLNGTYGYVVTEVTGVEDSAGVLHITGETIPSAPSESVTVTNGQVTVSGIVAGTQGVIARNVYRNNASGSPTTGPFYLVNQLTNNSQDSFTDDTADANLGVEAPTSNTTGSSFNGNLTVGLSNESVSQIKAVLLETDTRTTNLTYTNGQLTSVTEVDPTNGNAVVSTTNLTYTNGQLTSVAQTAGGHTVTSTLNYTNGQLSSVTKAVS